MMSAMCQKSANNSSSIGAFSYSIGEIRVSIGAFPISALDILAALTPHK